MSTPLKTPDGVDIWPGLYRGIVLNNDDPLGRRRVILTCNAVNGESPLDWAMPCRDFSVVSSNAESSTSAPVVLVATAPNPGTPVWVMFEHGDIEFPVYIGTWFA